MVPDSWFAHFAIRWSDLFSLTHRPLSGSVTRIRSKFILNLRTLSYFCPAIRLFISFFLAPKLLHICVEFSALRDWIWTFQSCRCCIPPLKRIWTVVSGSAGFSELLIWALHNKVIYLIFSVAYIPIKKDQNGSRLNTFCQDYMLCWLYWAINLSFT